MEGGSFNFMEHEKIRVAVKSNHVRLYKDYRDCLMVLTSKGVVIVNVHMPQPHEQRDRRRGYSASE